MNLSYKFFYWGPYLFQSTITAEFCQILLKAGAEARKKKRHYNHKLAGHIKNQFQLTHETLKNHLTDLLAAYIEGHKEFIYQNKIPEKTPVPSFTLQACGLIIKDRENLILLIIMEGIFLLFVL